MQSSIQRVVSDGTLEFIDLAIEYIDKVNVKVSVDDVPIGAPGSGTPYTYEWITAVRIKITPVVPLAGIVTLRRVTPTLKMYHVYDDGATFNDFTMDENFKQLLFIGQEAIDGGVATDFYSDINIHGYRIKSSADGVDPADLVTVRQYQADASGAYASRVDAAASKVAASVSAASAETSASASATSASSASTSAASATSSASSATYSATSAATSASSASASASAAASSYDSFDDRYLGAKTMDPAVDNDGDALQVGTLYWNTSTNEMRVYSGSAWKVSYLPVGTYVTETEFTAGLANKVSTTDLANTTDPAKGVALIGYKGRTLDDKLKEWISVADFGVVSDGVTDNTTAYSAMIAALPAGSTIYWPNGTYVGDFISSKPLVLRGNGSTLIGAGNFAVVEFQGTLGSYQNLSAAPKYGDISLNGVTGLTDDTMVLLYSGNTRPNDASQVNFEVLKVKSDGTVYDKVYSDQNGGTPRYAVVTPIKGVEVYDFEFAGGASTAHAIFVRYAQNVRISNIAMTGGAGSTVTLRATINATIDHIRRIKPSATGSGQGYNVALNITKYVKVDRVYGEETRHDFDQDSSYVTDVSGVISVNCLSSSIAVTHTGFGGFTSVRDCTIRTDAYAIHTSDQVNGGANLLFRHLVVDNINITNNKNMAAYDFYIGIYLQYPTEDVSIKNVTIKNVNNALSFDYKGGAYNTGYFAIRAFRPGKVFDVENVVVDAATTVVEVDSLDPWHRSASRLTIRNVTVDRFRDVVRFTGVLSNIGAVSVEDVGYFETSTVNGGAIVSILGTSGRLLKLMIRGLDNIPAFAKTISLAPGAGCPSYSYIDTAGFVRRLSSLNSLAAGGTITQYDYLTRGDFAVWTGASITLSTTEPIERPVTSGNIFAIFNGGAGSLTIPANSNTVTNTTDIVIAPGETHYFMASSDGTKWLRYKKETGTSLA